MNNTNKILKWIVYGGIFLIPLLPLFISSSMLFPYITGKNFAFRIIVEIILAAWLVLSWNDKNFRGKSSWLSLAVVAFTMIVGVADIYSVNPGKSIWSNYERMEGFVTIFHLWAYFIVLTAMFKTEKVWHALFNTFIGSGVIVCLYGLVQMGEKAADYRVDSTTGNPIYLAIYMVFSIFLSLFLLYRAFEKKGGLKKIFDTPSTYFYVPVMILNLFILYKTATRGALIGFLGGVLVTAILIAILEKKDVLLKKTAVGCVISVLILVAGFFAIKGTDFAKNNNTLARLSNISLSDIKSTSRTIIYPMAIKGFQEKPILGWGQESFNYVFNKYYDPRMHSQEAWFDRAHSVYLDWLIAAGLLGLLSYLSIYAILLVLIWHTPVGSKKIGTNLLKSIKSSFRFGNPKTDSPFPGDEYTQSITFTITERALLTGLLAAYAFHNIFVFDCLISYILFFTVLAYVHVQETTPESMSLSSWRRIFTVNEEVRTLVILPIMAIILLGSIYYVNGKPMLASQTLIEALVNNQVPATLGATTTPSIEAFRQALDYKSFGDSEIREQLMSYAGNLTRTQGVSDAIKNNVMNFTFDELNKQIRVSPEDLRYQIFTGSFLDNTRNVQQALPYLLTAEKLSPKKQMVKMELVRNYLSQGLKEEAMTKAKENFELATDFRDGRLLYVTTLIVNGKYDEADKVLREANDPTIFTDEQTLLAYVIGGHPEKAMLVWQQRISAKPNDPQIRSNFITFLLRVEQKALAINELSKMGKDFPQYKESVDKEIANLQAQLKTK